MDFRTPIHNALAKWLPNSRWPLRRTFPRRTFRLVPEADGNRWSLGSIANQPAMQVVGAWQVENISEVGALLVGVHIEKPYTEGRVLLEGEGGLYSSREILPARTTTRASAHFWILPPVRHEGEPFNATVVFVDQFGNKHSVRDVRFEGRAAPTGTSFDPGEPLYEIDDPVERDVAAVLKAELGRYQVSERSQGALGSIRTTEGQRTADGSIRMTEGQRTVDGFGGIVRGHPAAAIPLTRDPEVMRVESDNLEALLNRYGGLATDEERERFKRALLARLGRDRPYANAAYLILLVSLSVGWLPEALERAAKELPEAKDFAFSDCLILLDGLLRLQHHRFDDALLDAVDKFASGAAAAGEDTYFIAERIAAIRSWRMTPDPPAQPGK
jgi:hypothetical protein